MKFIYFLTVGLLLSSCKAATPELTSLLGSSLPSTSPPVASSGNGRLVSSGNLNQPVLPMGTLKVHSRVVAIPDADITATPGFKVRGRFE